MIESVKLKFEKAKKHFLFPHIISEEKKMQNLRNPVRKKNGQVAYIAPLRPPTLAPIKAWGIQQELVV